jgi:hypothetical protein
MGARPLQLTTRSTNRELVNRELLEVWERGPFSELRVVLVENKESEYLLEVWERGPITNLELVNGVLLEVWQRGPFSKLRIVVVET